MPNPMSTSEIEASLDFGDYCEIEQKRYGAPNEFYRYKVIGRSSSNYYHPVPVDANGNHRAYGDMCETVKVICCGVVEERVETFRLCDVRPLQSQGAEPVATLNESHCFSLEDTNRIMRLAPGAKLYTAPPAQAARVDLSELDDITRSPSYESEEMVEACISVFEEAGSKVDTGYLGRACRAYLREFLKAHPAQAAQAAQAARLPTDNGIEELDQLCQQFNDGRRDLTGLVCAIWNTASEPQHIRDRWNIEKDGDDLLICFNHHEKGESCEYERFVPYEKAQAARVPADRAMVLADRLYEAGYEDSRKERDYDPRGSMRWQKVVDAISAAPAPAEKVDDIERLIEFAAVQGLDLRDYGDNTDRSAETWRSLPDHLRDRLNRAAESLDEEAPATPQEGRDNG